MKKILVFLFVSLFVATVTSATPILVVDDDGSAWNPGEFSDIQGMFTDALDANEAEYDVIDLETNGGNGPDYETMSEYDIIIWFTGECWEGNQTLTPADEDNLADYLDNGGNLFLSAQDYFYDRYPNAGSFNPGDFPYDYLHVNSTSQDTWGTYSGMAEGQDGSIADTLAYELTDPFSSSSRDGLFIDYLSHDEITLMNVTQPNPEGPASLQYEAETHKVVFTTISFASLVDGDEGTKAELMGNILDYFEYGSSVKDVNTTDIPETATLHQNYPNPFNPTTEIFFELNTDSQVELNVYNMSGNLVKVLEDDYLSAGYHTVQWDGTNLKNESVSSGIYIYTISTENYSDSKSCILLK